MNPSLATVFLDASSGAVTFTLLDIAAKTFVLLAAACATALALRRAPASARHLAWLAALACALVLPLCSWMLPGWRVLPAWMRWQESPRPLAAPALAPERPVSFENVAPVATHTPERIAVVERSSATIVPAAPAARPFHVSTWLLVWAAGTTLFLIPLAWSLCALSLVMRRARPAGENLASEVAAIARELGLRRPVHLRLGAPEAMPMVCGIFRAHLLLPSSAAAWPAARLRAVLLHELAHLRRRDPLALLVAQLARAVHWFNPLAWFAVHRLRIEQEQACDDFVLRHGIRASEYASDLLAVATGLRPQPGAAVALTMARPARIEGRITSILDGGRNRASLTRRLILATALLAALIALPLAILSAADEKTKDATITSPAEWGQASPEGLRVRLQAEKREWKDGETPALALRLRNSGKLTWMVEAKSSECLVEVDGKWYGWPGTAVESGMLVMPKEKLDRSGAGVGNAVELPPSSAEMARPATVELSEDWTSLAKGEARFGTPLEASGEHLKLSPGHHTIRVRIQLKERFEGASKVTEATSNPIEIDVAAAVEGGKTSAENKKSVEAAVPANSKPPLSVGKNAEALPLIGVFIVAEPGDPESIAIPYDPKSGKTIAVKPAPVLVTTDFDQPGVHVSSPTTFVVFLGGPNLGARKKYSEACERYLGREMVWVVDGAVRFQTPVKYASPWGQLVCVDFLGDAAQAAELQKKFSAALPARPSSFPALPYGRAAEWAQAQPHTSAAQTAYKVLAQNNRGADGRLYWGLAPVQEAVIEKLGTSPKNAEALHALRRRIEIEEAWDPTELAEFLDKVAALDPALLDRLINPPRPPEPAPAAGTPSALLDKGASGLPLAGVYLVAKEGAPDSVTLPLHIPGKPETTVAVERVPVLTTTDFASLDVQPLAGGANRPEYRRPKKILCGLRAESQT